MPAARAGLLAIEVATLSLSFQICEWGHCPAALLGIVSVCLFLGLWAQQFRDVTQFSIKERILMPTSTTWSSRGIFALGNLAAFGVFLVVVVMEDCPSGNRHFFVF